MHMRYQRSRFSLRLQRQVEFLFSILVTVAAFGNSSTIYLGTGVYFPAEAGKEAYGGLDGSKEYTSARFNTKFRGSWTYGRVKVSARLPVGQFNPVPRLA